MGYTKRIEAYAFVLFSYPDFLHLFALGVEDDPVLGS